MVVEPPPWGGHPPQQAPATKPPPLLSSLSPCPRIDCAAIPVVKWDRKAASYRINARLLATYPLLGTEEAVPVSLPAPAAGGSGLDLTLQLVEVVAKALLGHAVTDLSRGALLNLVDQLALASWAGTRTLALAELMQELLLKRLEG